MLIKEYRIPLPMSVEEYRIAQLYMIQKKSRQESRGRENGIEIVENEPYTDGPGGQGQYTKKIYHIASHLPQWIKGVIPKSARSVKEEAWNAYPYTRTKFSCEFVPKFSLDIETRYAPDSGTQENIFNLANDEINQREVVHIDVATDKVDGEPPDEENVTLYKSEKTGRGPLSETWIADANYDNIMCSYKLCRVEFSYWGLQTRAERYVHDYAIRRTLTHAHRQAWVWQDEYYGLTIEDIRRLERETQTMLEEMMRENEEWPKKEDPLRSVEAGCLSQLSIESSEEGSEYFDAEPYYSDDDTENTGDLSDDQSVFVFSKRVSTFGTRSQSDLSTRSDETHAGCGRLLPTQKLLFLVFHGGTLLDMHTDTSKYTDCQTLHQSLQKVMETLCPEYTERIVIKLVPCPAVCADVLTTLIGSLPRTHGDTNSTEDITGYGLDTPFQVPFDLIPVLATQTAGYKSALRSVCKEANAAYREFQRDNPNLSHNQVTLIGDMVGALLAHSMLSTVDEEEHVLDFIVDNFFSFGSPIANVLLHQALVVDTGGTQVHPKKLNSQFYNLFYASSPGAVRVEPILDSHFTYFSPVCIPRFNKAPYGDGKQYSVSKLVRDNESFFKTPSQPLNPAPNNDGLSPTTVGKIRPISTSNLGLSGLSEWWGNKRLDYALYYPEALRSFPPLVLPALLHSSFWENYDVAAFIIRQVLELDGPHPAIERKSSVVVPKHTEKWIRRRTRLKVHTLNPNHRCLDAIYLQGQDQIIQAKFQYGPLDALSLVGEKVDIRIKSNPIKGDWKHVGSDQTKRGGRINYKLNDKLSVGLYPVKCVVRGDNSTADGFIAVVPPNSECVVFSIDGSFTASMSLMGRDPKIRPGAVEVVKFWKDLGFIILYITARPDLQKQSVIEWLGQHQFPHGIVAFGDGISAEPLRSKTEYLTRLREECKMSIYAAYGSAKDISVYKDAGISPSQMYIVGKANKKLQCNIIETYDAHLDHLLQTVHHLASWNSNCPGGHQFPRPSSPNTNSSSVDKRFHRSLTVSKSH